MKKLLIILLFALPVLLYGQNTFKYRVDALGGIKVGTNGAVLDSIKASTAEINYVDGVTSPIQTQLNTKLAKTDTSTLSNRIDAINTTIEDTVLATDYFVLGAALSDSSVMLDDVKPLFVFGGGGGNARDTAVFTTSTIYGSFFNESRDTLIVTSLRVVMLGDATDTLSVDILWDVNLNDATPTELNADPLPVNSFTSGDEDTSFAVSKIPPDVWVWCETPGVVLTRKPNYFNAQISGYIKRTE